MPRATFGIGLAASSATGVSSRMVNGLTPCSPAPAVVVEQGSTLDAPLRDAADVDVWTDLQWTNPTGRPGLVMVLFMGNPDYPMYHLFTGGSRVAIPDLAEWGVRPPRKAKANGPFSARRRGRPTCLQNMQRGNRLAADDLRVYGISTFPFR